MWVDLVTLIKMFKELFVAAYVPVLMCSGRFYFLLKYKLMHNKVVLVWDYKCCLVMARQKMAATVFSGIMGSVCGTEVEHMHACTKNS